MAVTRSSVFDKWLSGLRDRQAMARIGARLDRLALGTSVMQHPSATESPNSGSTTGRVTGCIACAEVSNASFRFVAETSRPRCGTLRGLKRSPESGRNEKWRK